MLSMTGYGQAVAEEGALRVSVTLRGVNHRFLDVSMRLPEVCRPSEPALQGLVAAAMERGRLELSVEVVAAESATTAQLNTALASELVEAARKLSVEGLADGSLEVSDLLRMPGVVESRSSVSEWNEDSEALLQRVCGEALAQFTEARRAEGARMQQVLEEKYDALGTLLARLQELRPEVQKALTEAQLARLTELLDGRDVDPQRLAVEAAVLLDKTNVSEELERLEIHLDHLREVSSQQGAIGKRLDFLVQEVFRELNTLSAKCRNSEMTQACVDSKVLCEEVREQLRNVE
jgi:uncharacterized protein (TIGR00255 family)